MSDAPQWVDALALVALWLVAAWCLRRMIRR